MKKISRREFLRGSAAGMAVAALSGLTGGVLVSAEENSDGTESLIYHFSGSSSTLSKWSHSANYFVTAFDYMVFDPLINMDEEGNYVPGLASEWELFEDGSGITLTIRDGAYFSNGKQVTGEDVKFTFEQMRDDTEHYPDSVVQNWCNYLGEIEADGQVVTLNFVQAFPEFWKLISAPDVQVIPSTAYDEQTWDEFWAAPIGSGAYVVSSWDAANSIVKVTRRTDENGWWGYEGYGLSSNVKDITLAYSTESSTRLASLRAGEIDLMDTVPTSEVVNLDNEGFITTVTAPGNVVFLEFACGEEDAFGDQNLREALSLCIDRDLIVEALLDGYGYPAKWFALEGDLGYLSEEDGANYYQYDIERAKELVAASSYDGSALNFIYTSSTVNIGGELCQAIQSMAAEVGINLEITVLETAVYDEARSNHEFDLCLAAIAKSGNMWYKQAHDVIGTDRFGSGCTNEELINLGLSLGETSDNDELNEILLQMYEIQSTTFENYINIYFPTTVFAQNSAVSGIQWHNFLIPDLSAVTKA
ncbi:MAG: ABC transporter substrate-binding protein [Clostridiales bacterium]|nr:ABC transporter substrate-binding protein [Clostridiales bacterium]